MMKMSRSWLVAAALAAIGASVVVPAGWSIYTLANVSETVAGIDKQNTQLTAIRSLIDELAEIDQSYMEILNGLAIDEKKRVKIDQSIQAMTSFESPLDLAMSLSAHLIPPEDQVKLWNAVQAIVHSWTEYTKSDPENSQQIDKEFHALQISESLNEVKKIVRVVNDALTNENKLRAHGTIDRLQNASMLLITIFFGGIVITASASLLVVVVMRVTRRAERAIRTREAALSQQNLQFKAALDNMRHGLTMYDADGRLEIYNNRVLDIYGFPPGSVAPGMTVEDMTAVRLQRGHKVTSESGEELENLFDEHRENVSLKDGDKSLWDEDERNIVVNGRDVRVTRSPRVDGGYVVMHADITERHQALINLEARENELTEQIQRFKDLVEGVPFGLSMFDADQRLIVCNRPYVDIYGLDGNQSRSRDDVQSNCRQHIWTRDLFGFITRCARGIQEKRKFDDSLEPDYSLQRRPLDIDVAISATRRRLGRVSRGRHHSRQGRTRTRSQPHRTGDRD